MNDRDSGAYRRNQRETEYFPPSPYCRTLGPSDDPFNCLSYDVPRIVLRTDTGSEVVTIETNVYNS